MGASTFSNFLYHSSPSAPPLRWRRALRSPAAGADRDSDAFNGSADSVRLLVMLSLLLGVRRDIGVLVDCADRLLAVDALP
jgi:hypothetical protein